jgi:aldehyde:ferredoxin oxidoreductase
MQYLADEGTVIYSAKDGKDRKVFDAPEWLATMWQNLVTPVFREYYAYRKWYWETGKPTKERLLEFGLEEATADLYA